MENSTFCNIVTSGTCDFVADVTFICKFWSRSFHGGLLPKWIKYNDFMTPCFVLSCLVLFARSCIQVKLLHRSSRFMAQTTCFGQRPFFRVRVMTDVILGNYAPMPQTPTKCARIGNLKPKRNNINTAISPKL